MYPQHDAIDGNLIAEVRGWLRDNLPPSDLPPIYTRDGVRLHREWEARLAEAGLSAVQWPTEFGGRDASALTAAAIGEEFVRAGAPERLNPSGLALFGPTLMAHGTEAQQRRWLPGILTCDQLWCQGFSEPEAGSDLASLRTRATVGTAELVVNGQKIWTSLAEFADWIFALVRTGTPEERHRGITYVAIPLDAPGVSVRPIRQVTGAQSFAEVFFEDVRVPLENVIGSVGDGWNVAMSTLGRERGAALHTPAHLEAALEELAALIRSLGAQDAPHLERTVGELYEEVAAYREMVWATLIEAQDGVRPGRQAALSKLWWSELSVRLYDTGRDLLQDLAPDDGRLSIWEYRTWHARAGKLLAGTSEIQKNIVAERVLGLPKEARGA